MKRMMCQSMVRWMLVLTFGLWLAGCAAITGRYEPEAPVMLFNGRNLDGWRYFSEDPAVPMGDVWSVQDGVLICKGLPMGYIYTDKAYKNYHLIVEWRWQPGTEGGNSGVLLHTTPNVPSGRGIWPKCLEAQLRKDQAGDFVFLGETIKVDDQEARQQGIAIPRLVPDVENPLGEWNRMEIICKGDAVTIWVNNELVNHGYQGSADSGHIALQSEGAPIHFRNIQLLPLDQ